MSDKDAAVDCSEPMEESYGSTNEWDYKIARLSMRVKLMEFAIQERFTDFVAAFKAMDLLVFGENDT